MFMSGVLFMLGVIACCIAVNLAVAFWPIVLGVIFVLAVGLAAVIAPGQVVPVVVGLPVLLALFFLPIAIGVKQDAKRLEAERHTRARAGLSSLSQRGFRKSTI